MRTAWPLNFRSTLRGTFVLLPLIAFSGLALAFFVELHSGYDENLLPSPLIGKVAPKLELPALSGPLKDGGSVPGISATTMKGKLTLLTFWASWCAPCREEQPLLMQLASDKNFELVGVDYKDQESSAKNFLDEFGNPYAAVGIDRSGDTGIEWGVYGIPETFLISAGGVVLYKHVGPLSKAAIREELMPLVERAKSHPVR